MNFPSVLGMRLHVEPPKASNGFSDLHPRYATESAACLDIMAAIPEPVTLFGGDVLDCRTGLTVEVPAGYVMMIFGRSGLAFKHGVRLANSVAIIDPDYRGEVRVKLIRDLGAAAGATFVVHPGDRIAQMLVLPVPRLLLETVPREVLTETARGEGGLGSTGVGGLDSYDRLVYDPAALEAERRAALQSTAIVTAAAQ